MSSKNKENERMRKREKNILQRKKCTDKYKNSTKKKPTGRTQNTDKCNKNAIPKMNRE